jgi:c-di-GMP-binding flagellar brake protein YcgR
MDNNRRYERYSTESIDLHGKILFSTDIRILNMSVGGISFTSDKCLTNGGVYVLRLERKDSKIYLEGSILWSKPNENSQEDGNSKAFTVGMKFLHPSYNQRREIEQFIQDNFIDYQKVETFAPVMSGIRIYVRFRINAPDKATINCAEHYKVRRISKSGMLIESSNLLPIEDRAPMQMRLSEKKDIAFWARIVTCHAIRKAEPMHYAIGIEFIDMSEKDRSALDGFVDSFEDNNKVSGF